MKVLVAIQFWVILINKPVPAVKLVVGHVCISTVLVPNEIGKCCVRVVSTTSWYLPSLSLITAYCVICGIIETDVER